MDKGPRAKGVLMLVVHDNAAVIAHTFASVYHTASIVPDARFLRAVR